MQNEFNSLIRHHRPNKINWMVILIANVASKPTGCRRLSYKQILVGSTPTEATKCLCRIMVLPRLCNAKITVRFCTEAPALRENNVL